MLEEEEEGLVALKEGLSVNLKTLQAGGGFVSSHLSCQTDT